MQPLFVTAGEGVREPIEAMPGIERLSISEAVAEVTEVAAAGVRAVLLFGIPVAEGRVRDPGLRRRGRGPDGGPGAEGGPPRGRRDHRCLPLRVHGQRAVRRRPRGPPARRRRQRPHGRAAGQDRDLPRRRGRRRGRAERHDGRPHRLDPPPARRGGALGGADHRLQRQVRIRLLRPLPRGGRLGPRGGPARVPDGSRQRRRGRARGRAGPGGGRRRRHGQARASLPGRGAQGQGRDRRAGRRLPRQRRVLGAEGRRRQRLDRRARRGAGVPDRDPPRRAQT